MQRLHRIETIDAARGVAIAWIRKGTYLVCLAGVGYGHPVPASGRAEMRRRVRAALAAHDRSEAVASLIAAGALRAGGLWPMAVWQALDSAD